MLIDKAAEAYKKEKAAELENFRYILSIILNIPLDQIWIVHYSDRTLIAKIDGMVFVHRGFDKFTLGKFCSLCHELVAADMYVTSLSDLYILLQDNAHFGHHWHFGFKKQKFSLA